MKRKYKALHAADVSPTSMVVKAFLSFPATPTCIWDVGSGPAKVLIESALRYPASTQLIGIERNPQYLELARVNMARHGVAEDRITLVERCAVQDSLEDLPRPDAIYFSFAGSAEQDLLPMLWELLLPGGVIVCNVSTAQENPKTEVWIERLRSAQGNMGGLLEEYEHWYDVSLNPTPIWRKDPALHWTGKKPVQN